MRLSPVRNVLGCAWVMLPVVGAFTSGLYAWQFRSTDFIDQVDSMNI